MLKFKVTISTTLETKAPKRESIARNKGKINLYGWCSWKDELGPTAKKGVEKGQINKWNIYIYISNWLPPIKKEKEWSKDEYLQTYNIGTRIRVYIFILFLTISSSLLDFETIFLIVNHESSKTFFKYFTIDFMLSSWTRRIQIQQFLMYVGN